MPHLLSIIAGLDSINLKIDATASLRFRRYSCLRHKNRPRVQVGSRGLWVLINSRHAFSGLRVPCSPSQQQFQSW